MSYNLPYIEDALDGWMQSMLIKKVTKAIVNYRVVETTTDQTILAVRQPFTTRQLMVRPEGQRQWQWEKLHVKHSDVFNLDDVIYFGTRKYRIFGINEWQQYGYVEYDIAQGYTE